MVRVLVIGSGPSGMSVLYQTEKLRSEGCKDLPEIVCYEKGDDWGGLWNYNWRTGLDQYGEYVHGSMYRYLWSNGPKEASLEFPDYTFEDHFGKSIPSFPPREVLFDYLKGRWAKYDLKSKITFSHVVRSVDFDEKTNKFKVVVKDLKQDSVKDAGEFDFVVNCSGHFSVPNVPYFPGFDRFPGRIMHSHDFRDAVEFKNTRLLIIGSSYSAEDIALQTMKYGAKSVVISYRTSPMNFKWPKGIEERPLLTKVEGSVAHFKDGSTAEIDAIMLATGYLHSYPYLSEPLRLTGPNELYPPNLYKGTLWLKGGNNRLLYVGIQDQYNTYTMFDAQARWAVKYIAGEIKLPAKADIEKDIKSWRDKQATLKDCYEEIDYQAGFADDLAKESKYGYSINVAALFTEWEHDKHRDILTYRDKSFTSIYTGNKSPVHHSTFMEALDDSMKTYLAIK